MERRTTRTWLSTGEAAASVGMSTEWVRRQIHEGRLTADRWGIGRGTFRIPRAKWDEFVRRWRVRTDRDDW